MNVLIIGGAGSLINQIIRKLKKEGHRVHLLTGSRYADGNYEKVFEKYDLTYDSECLTDVFDSVNPDVTLFMGAFDSNFKWNNEEREMVRFTSSLTNFLMSFSMSKKGRFIFLSSDEVYSESCKNDISEDEPTTPKTLKGMALAQCEDICDSFIRIREYDIVTLRLDHLYKIPKDLSEVNDVCSKMCLEAMKSGTVSASESEKLSLLYDSDAVEFIYQLFRYKNHIHSVYNLSSSDEVTKLEIAQYIQQAMGEDANITVEEKDGPEHRIVLSNQRFDSEFGVRIFAKTQETVGKIVSYMTERKEIFLDGEQRKKTFFERMKEKAGWFVRAMIPYIENIIFFLLFFVLNGFAMKSQYFSRLDLYLLYVLLFAVVHGQQQATFSAIFAVFGYFFSQTGDRSLLNVVLDYNTYIWIAQLFIVGLVVGYMKDQIRKLKMENEEERKFLNRQLSDIKDINGSNVRVKDALEAQIVNQNDSIGKIYSITSKLEKYTPEEVLFYAADMLRNFLGSDDIAIYTVSNDYYARLFTFTSEKSKSLGKSIRYRDLGDVYETLAAKKVYINRTLDERYPMMAAPIFESDKLQIMIMAWGIPWERMTLGQADLLMIVSYLIQNAVLRATRYINLIENRRYQEGKLVMEEEAFSSLVKVFLEAKDNHLTECVLIRLIIPENAEELLSTGTVAAAAAAATAAEAGTDKTIRHTDTGIQAKPERGYAVSVKKPAKKTGFLSGLKFIHLPIIGSKHTKPAPKAAAKPAKPSTAHKTAAAATVAAAAVQKSEPLNDNAEMNKYEIIAKGLVGKIRNTDYVGVLEDGNMYVLLCNTNSTEASSAVERIKSGGYNCILLEDYKP